MKPLNLLLVLSLPAKGFLWTLLILFLCVTAVHAVRLIRLGIRLSKKLPEQKPKIPERKSEPVYFIVERKKKRAKTEYSAPREVKFK